MLWRMNWNYRWAVSIDKVAIDLAAQCNCITAVETRYMSWAAVIANEKLGMPNRLNCPLRRLAPEVTDASLRKGVLK